MRKDTFEFQKAGDICENCKERWENAGKPLVTLVGLPTFTMRYHTPVAICSYCDGGEIGKIAVMSANTREINASNK